MHVYETLESCAGPAKKREKGILAIAERRA
jgi:hypothetical protein